MWPNLQEATDLVTFTEEIVNGKIHFLCSDPRVKLKALTKIFNTDVWVIVTFKQPFARGSYTQIKFSRLKKNKTKQSSYWQNRVSCDSSILYSHSICLNTSFWQFCMQMFALSIGIPSTENGQIFQETCFQYKVLKTIQNLTFCHKMCWKKPPFRFYLFDETFIVVQAYQKDKKQPRFLANSCT